MIWNSELSKCSSCWNSLLFHVPNSLKFRNHSRNFLKFCESTVKMMRICLLWASANRMLLWKLIILVKLLGFIYVVAFQQIGISSRNWAQQFSFKDGDINVQWKQPFLCASLFLLSKCLQSSIYVVILVWV